MSERIGKYILEERIGAGGMAEVYRARVEGPQGFEKIVAVKRVLPIFGDDQDFVRMFIQEARVAAKLQHGNIVQIFDFDQEAGRYYLAMEYVAGKDLRAALRAAGAPPSAGIPTGLALYIGGEVLRALHYAQQTLGLVHRDISPHNVLLGFSGDVKLGDFGIAKAQAAASATRTGSIKGKIAYMAPEQVDGSDVDGRTDLFAMGIVIYEMLSGKRPFTGASDAEMVARVLAANIEPLGKLRPEIPEDVAAVVDRLLQRDPAARYQTALEALTALTSCAMYRADPVGVGTWLQGLFPEASAPATRVTRSETGGRTAEVGPEGAPAFALAATRTSSPDGATVPARKRPRRTWVRWAPLPVALLLGVGALALRSGGRRPDPPAAATAKPVAAAATVPVPAAPAAPVPAAPAAPPPVAPPASTPDAAVASAKVAAKAPSRKRSSSRTPRGPTGVLRVGAEPWAYIKINGKSHGQTPKEIVLAPGSYKVELSGPRFKRKVLPATVRASETTKVQWPPATK